MSTVVPPADPSDMEDSEEVFYVKARRRFHFFRGRHDRGSWGRGEDFGDRAGIGR